MNRKLQKLIFVLSFFFVFFALTHAANFKEARVGGAAGPTLNTSNYQSILSNKPIYLIFDDTLSSEYVLNNVSIEKEDDFGFKPYVLVQKEIIGNNNTIKLTAGDDGKWFNGDYNIKIKNNTPLRFKISDDPNPKTCTKWDLTGINAECGILNNKGYKDGYTFISTHGSDLYGQCKIGKSRTITYNNSTKVWTWICDGLDKGNLTTCHAYVKEQTANCITPNTTNWNWKWNTKSTIRQTRSSWSSNFSPSTSTSYQLSNNTSNTCRYNCKAGYEHDSGSCNPAYHEYKCENNGIWSLVSTNAATTSTYNSRKKYIAEESVFFGSSPGPSTCTATATTICKTNATCATGWTAQNKDGATWKTSYNFQCKRNNLDKEVVSCSNSCGIDKIWNGSSCVGQESTLCSSSSEINTCKQGIVGGIAAISNGKKWSCTAGDTVQSCLVCDSGYQLNDARNGCVSMCNNASGGFPYCFDIVFDI